MEQDELEQVADFFRSMREVPWYDDALSTERPFTNSWVDVYVPELCEALGFNWLVTISTEEDDEIVREPASKLAMTWNGKDMEGPPATAVVSYKDWEHSHEFTADNGGAPFGEWEMFTAKKRSVIDGNLVIEAAVYSVPEVGDLMAEWAASIGAEGVQFKMCDGDSPLLKEAKERLEAFESGEGTAVPLSEVSI